MPIGNSATFNYLAGSFQNSPRDTPSYPKLHDQEMMSSSPVINQPPQITDVDDISSKVMVFSSSHHQAQASITSCMTLSAREFDAKDYLCNSTNIHQKVKDLEFEKDGLGKVNLELASMVRSLEERIKV